MCSIEEAKQYIETKFTSETIQWVDKGQMNFIAIVGDKFVFKFPKTPENFKLLQKEHAIYDMLHGKVSLPMPKSIELNTEEQFLQVSYVAGKTPTEADASSMTPLQKSDLAHKLAVFIKELNAPDVKKSFDVFALTDTNDFYYVENWLKRTADHCKQNQSKMSTEFLDMYSAFSQALPYGFCTGDFLAHKDLHEDNMLFNDKNTLVGIIDFAEVRYTSIYSELRTVIRFGDEVVSQIISELGDLASNVRTQDVKLFATIYEMAIVYQNTYIKNELPWRVEQARFYLKLWEQS